MTFDHFLVIVHFIGLALGFSSGFGNMVLAGLVAKAPANEKPILARVASWALGVEEKSAPHTKPQRQLRPAIFR